jgi:nucleoside-diphosphate-sugar epimerase
LQRIGSVSIIGSVVVRFSNVYRRFDDSEHVVPRFIRRIHAREDLTIFGKGQTYDFTFIDDAVDGDLAVFERFEKVRGNTFNLATGQGSTLEQTARTLQKIIGIKSSIRVKTKRVGELMYYVADISKAQDHLDYNAKAALEKGLKRAVDWHRNGRKRIPLLDPVKLFECKRPANPGWALR